MNLLKQLGTQTATLVTSTRRLFNLRWRLSSKLLTWADQLIVTEVQEIDQAIDEDPQRAAGLIDNLGCRVDRAGVVHPVIFRLDVRLRRLRALQKKPLLKPGIYETISEPIALGEDESIKSDITIGV